MRLTAKKRLKSERKKSLQILRHFWKLHVIKRRAKKVSKKVSAFEPRTLSPIQLAIMGVVLYCFLWLMSYVYVASDGNILRADPNKISVFESINVWQSISIAATLAIAIQVLAGSLRYDEKSIKNRRILLVHAEKYLSFIPVLIGGLSTLPVVGYIFDSMSNFERSQKVPSFFELMLLIAFHWTILALCADAHNRFSGNLLLEKERVYLIRSASMRKMRFMKAFQPPKNKHDRSFSNVIESLFLEIAVVFIFSTVVVLAYYSLTQPKGMSNYLTYNRYELLNIMLPGILMLGSFYWVFSTIFTCIFIYIIYSETIQKIYGVAILIMYLFVMIAASISTPLVMVGLFPPLIVAVLARMSKPVGKYRTWFIGWTVFPGNFARTTMSKYFWKNYEIVWNRIKECNLKIDQYKSE